MAASTKRSRFLANASAILAKGELNDVQSMEWTGEGFAFSFSHSAPRPANPIQIRVLCDDDTYFAYTESEVPAKVASVLEHVAGRTSGMALESMLKDLVGQLRASLSCDADSTELHDAIMTDVDDSSSEDDAMSDDLDFDYGDELDDATLFDEPIHNRSTQLSGMSALIAYEKLSRIRRDLAALRSGGFRVGIVRGFTTWGYENILSASVRVDKLHLPKETREAWGLETDDFVVLLIRYSDGKYTTFEDALNRPASSCKLDFRLRKCSNYKPTSKQATSIFSKSRAGLSETSTAENYDEGSRVSHLCVGDSIDLFMDKDFIPMLKLRHTECQTWTSAKEQLRELSRAPSRTTSLPVLSSAKTVKGSKVRRDIPLFLTHEHIEDLGEKSLPLIAARFAFKCFVRCTRYCMVCQGALDSNFVSLKPYVCGNPLCLFQYMALGFGPSVEHEVLNQPYVVDLLISFCSFSLSQDMSGKVGMRELPTGLGLKVPRIRWESLTRAPAAAMGDAIKNTTETTAKQSSKHPNKQPAKQSSKQVVKQKAIQPNQQPAKQSINQSIKPKIRQISGGELIDPINAEFNWSKSTVTMVDCEDVMQFQIGQLLVVVSPYISPITPFQKSSSGSKKPAVTEMGPDAILHHARVKQIAAKTIHLHVTSRHAWPSHLPFDNSLIAQHDKDRSVQVYIVQCDQNMDDLETEDQVYSMQLLLASLPSVSQMRDYLLGSGGSNSQLAKWSGISPPALSLLRWIVASNRSCIMQIDKAEDNCMRDRYPKGMTDGAVDPRRIYGVDGWVQFRFAQGSPEQEIRFQDSLKLVQQQHQTLLAWHGSPLKNWQSIIRQGLNHTEVANGRVYGDGVYFSKHFDTSLSYCKQTGVQYSKNHWSKSMLNITAALSLVELVNVPEQFKSRQPHYVVQKCNWIQCRYIFVRPAHPESAQASKIAGHRDLSEDSQESSTWSTAPDMGDEEFYQDPVHAAMGPKGEPLRIPRLAMGSTSMKEQDAAIVALRNSERGHRNDSFIDGEDAVDASFFQLGHKNAERDLQAAEANSAEPKTAFRPGSLDVSKLRLLSPPAYATSTGTKMLGRELKKLEAIQNATESHMLGWYIDFDSINNMYQWIVELHSFDMSLPLAQDLETVGLTSIVLEMRFGREFPHSPPFIRVIKPRFLPFLQGGGGHVTAGGAMCMELLTNSGWSPVSSLESVLLQVRLAICSTEPKPARLESMNPDEKNREYGIFEAFEAYKRAAATHGWAVPSDFTEAFSAAAAREPGA